MGGQGLVVVFEKLNNKIRIQGLWDLAMNSIAMVGKFGPNEVFITIEEKGIENAY